MAEALIDGIIEFQPKLLIGTLDIKSVKEAREYHKEIKRFIYQAALYHDLGKNSIISVVNNDYRPLSNEERVIIRMHPEMGLKFLAIDESLAPLLRHRARSSQMVQRQGRLPRKLRQHPFAQTNPHRHRHAMRLYAGCHRAFGPQLQDREEL